MDTTTLSLAVDSTQVNSATAALAKMAGEGGKAETIAGKLTTTSLAQGKALSGSLVPAATKATSSISDLAEASAEIAPSKQLAAGVAELAATAAKANSATAAMQQLASAAQDAGEKVQSSFSKAATTASAGAGPTESGGSTLSNAASSLGVGKTATDFSSVGKASKEASQSIDDYIKKLQTTVATNGMSARETKLYELALRGASKAQLEAASSAIQLDEAYKKGERIGNSIKSGLLALGAAAATGIVAAYVAFDQLIKKAGDFQDIAEKTGDSAQNIASLAVAAGTAGTSMNEISEFSIRLTKNLTGVDDESKAAGAAIKALGLDLDKFKNLKPADQIEALGKALNSFANGPEKTAVMEALARGASQLLPFLKEIGDEGGRQVILTQKQIELADEYADKQAKLRAQISLHAQAIAADLLPAITEFKQAILDLVKDQEHASTISDTLKSALAGVGMVFQSIAIITSDVGFVFKGVGREIGAIAAQLNALAHLDFSGFRAIGDAVKEDSARARTELDRFQARIMAIGKPPEPTDPANYSNEGRNNPTQKRPTLSFNGATKNLKSKAGQEAKAQLAFDLDEIRKASAATADAFSNAEKIMQARRAAGLINDQDYYASKLGFIRLFSEEQETELQKELARLQKEKLAGKDKIDNDRKIVDVQAKIAKVRADALASIEVNATQEEAANKRVAQSYLDAATAAQAYIDTVKRQNAREVDGVGRGSKFRAQQSEQNRIEDKFTVQRQSLEGDLRRNQITPDQFKSYLSLAQDTYRQEVALFADRTARIEALQSDGFNGLTEALHNYADESRNFARLTEDAVGGALKGLEDSFVSLATTGKLTFKDLLKSINGEAVRIGVKSIIGTAANAITGGKPGAISSIIGGTTGQAGQTAAIVAQTTAIHSSVIALDALAASANAAAGMIGNPGAPGIDGAPSIRTIGDFSRFDRGQTGGQSDAGAGTAARDDAQRSVEQLSRSTVSAAADVAALASAADKSGGALSQLPSIISIIQSAAAAMRLSSAASNGSSGGGLIGSIVGAFSGGGYNYTGDASGSLFSATGDAIRGRREKGGRVEAGGTYLVGEKGRELFRPDRAGTIIPNKDLHADAVRYHTGGIAGQVPDKPRSAVSAALKANEVPAILLRNEEVLRRDDPRHRDNLAVNVLAKIMGGAKSGNKSTSISSNWFATTHHKDGDMRSSSSNSTRNESSSVTNNLRNITSRVSTDSAINQIHEGNQHSMLVSLLQRVGVAKPLIDPKLKESAPSIAAMQVAGARELGGPVSAGRMYRVNEKRPELLNVAGKQYLMMGAQPGKVEQTAERGNGGNTYVTVQVTPPAGASRETAMQFGATAGRQLQHAMRRNT